MGTVIPWKTINEEQPEYCRIILIAYADSDGSNKGISFGSLQPNDEWLIDSFDCVKGEPYEEGFSVITHWSDYQDWFNYPE